MITLLCVQLCDSNPKAGNCATDVLTEEPRDEAIGGVGGELLVVLLHS
jgi:hypothetical protein